MKAGSYTARADGQVVLGASMNKSTPFIECYFKINGGELDGQRVRWTSYMSENTWERTTQSLEYCGWSGEDISVFSDGKLHGLDKNDVEVVVEEETFTSQDGSEKSTFRVAWVNRLGYLNTAAAMTGDAVTAFSARMNALIAGRRAKSPVTSPSVDSEEEIPF